MAKRFEDKYICTEGELVIATSGARALLSPDPMGERGIYTVRSLYFDGPDRPCLAANEAGDENREKYRLRLYNGDKSFIRAEIKQKQGSVSEKFSSAVDESLARELAFGLPEPDKMPSETLRRFALKIRGEGYRPRTLCEYRREAYVGEPGKVRVTADRDLRAFTDPERFFEADIGPGIPVFELGCGLLEVKYTSLLPLWIARGVIPRGVERTSFSKYRMCSY